MRVDVERARALCGTTDAGTNLLQLTRAAEKLGFAVRAAKAPTWDVLLECPTPLIAQIDVMLGDPPEKCGQLVVVRSITRDGVDFIETSVGPRHLSRPDFEAIWTRAVVIFQPPQSGR